MPLIKKIGEIEVYETSEDLSKYTRKEREKIINDLFKKEYVGKEISYLLNDKEIHAIINSTTRNNYIAWNHYGRFLESKAEFKLRQDLAASGDYLNLICNAKYQCTNNEMKKGQNSKHMINNMWHNFNKSIMFNNNIYQLTLNIRENDGIFYIHNSKLKEK